MRLLVDADFNEELDIVASELIDEYVELELSPVEREQFEQHFLATENRKERLSFARALKKHKLELVSKKNLRRKLLRHYLPIAASVLILIGLGLIWRLHNSKNDLDTGLIALKMAYKQQRPFEERISQFNYAPVGDSRGDAPITVDRTELDRAERILLDAAHNYPDPASLHALGRLYLAEGKFEQAQAQLGKALSQVSNDAQTNCDMGTALMELGKAERAKDAGKSLENLGRSLQFYNRALELNDSLLEAIFNRALLFQEMSIPTRAREEWRKYLEKDPTSDWANEGRRKLKILDERSETDQHSNVKYYDVLQNAYQGGDTWAAWIAISESRSRFGNTVVEQIVSEYLDFLNRGLEEDAKGRLRLLGFAGEIENQEAGDRYTTDLAAFYLAGSFNQRLAAAKGRNLVQLANLHYNKSEFEAALNLYTEAGRLFETAGDKCESLFAQSLAGYCDLRIPDVKESVRVFEYLNGVYEEKQYKSLLAQSLHAMSDAETSENEISKALSYATRSLAVSEQIRDNNNKLRCLQQFVSMQLMLGNYGESLKAGHGGMELSAAISADRS